MKVPPTLGCPPGDTVTHPSPVPTPFPAACVSCEAQPSGQPSHPVASRLGCSQLKLTPGVGGPAACCALTLRSGPSTRRPLQVQARTLRGSDTVGILPRPRQGHVHKEAELATAHSHHLVKLSMGDIKLAQGAGLGLPKRPQWSALCPCLLTAPHNLCALQRMGACRLLDTTQTSHAVCSGLC